VSITHNLGFIAFIIKLQRTPAKIVTEARSPSSDNVLNVRHRIILDNDASKQIMNGLLASYDEPLKTLTLREKLVPSFMYLFTN